MGCINILPMLRSVGILRFAGGTTHFYVPDRHPCLFRAGNLPFSVLVLEVAVLMLVLLLFLHPE